LERGKTLTKTNNEEEEEGFEIQLNTSLNSFELKIEKMLNLNESQCVVLSISFNLAENVTESLTE